MDSIKEFLVENGIKYKQSCFKGAMKYNINEVDLINILRENQRDKILFLINKRESLFADVHYFYAKIVKYCSLDVIMEVMKIDKELLSACYDSLSRPDDNVEIVDYFVSNYGVNIGTYALRYLDSQNSQILKYIITDNIYLNIKEVFLDLIERRFVQLVEYLITNRFFNDSNLIAYTIDKHRFDKNYFDMIRLFLKLSFKGYIFFPAKQINFIYLTSCKENNFDMVKIMLKYLNLHLTVLRCGLLVTDDEKIHQLINDSLTDK
jgi:hypothetical protein